MSLERKSRAAAVCESLLAIAIIAARVFEIRRTLTSGYFVYSHDAFATGPHVVRRLEIVIRARAFAPFLALSGYSEKKSV
jgi:hypothetical protein